MWVHKVLEVSVIGRVAAKFKINVFSPYNKINWYKDAVIRRFSQRLLAQLIRALVLITLMSGLMEGASSLLSFTTPTRFLELCFSLLVYNHKLDVNLKKH